LVKFGVLDENKKNYSNNRACFFTYTATAEVYADKIPVVSDLELKLSGFAHFQAGLRNQSKLDGLLPAKQGKKCLK